jgi:hypothetical protein
VFCPQQRVFHSNCTKDGSEKVTFMPHYQMVAAEVAFDKLQSPHQCQLCHWLR